MIYKTPMVAGIRGTLRSYGKYDYERGYFIGDCHDRWTTSAVRIDPSMAATFTFPPPARPSY